MKMPPPPSRKARRVSPTRRSRPCVDSTMITDCSRTAVDRHRGEGAARHGADVEVGAVLRLRQERARQVEPVGGARAAAHDQDARQGARFGEREARVVRRVAVGIVDGRLQAVDVGRGLERHVDGVAGRNRHALGRQRPGIGVIGDDRHVGRAGARAEVADGRDHLPPIDGGVRHRQVRRAAAPASRTWRSMPSGSTALFSSKPLRCRSVTTTSRAFASSISSSAALSKRAA